MKPNATWCNTCRHGQGEECQYRDVCVVDSDIGSGLGDYDDDCYVTHPSHWTPPSRSMERRVAVLRRER
jgi:hypothetical protein